MKKFEYKIVDVPFNAWSGKATIDIEATLNRLGLQGWELVLKQQFYEGGTNSLVFKREIISA
jgi:Domain of unknown function (DUF4177)